MVRRLRLASVAFLASSIASVAPARAAGRLITRAGDTTAIEALSVAVARAPSRTTTWLSATVSTGSEPFALVLPTFPGATVDASTRAWLTALDDSTAPRIQAPLGAPSCGGIKTTLQSTAAPTSVPYLKVSQIAVLPTESDLFNHVAAAGLDLASADSDALTGRAPYVVLHFPAANGASRTEPVRMVAPGVVSVPLPVAFDGQAIDVTLWTLGDGRSRLPNLSEIDAHDLSVVWKLSAGESNYLSARSEWLSGENGVGVVLEASSTSALYDWAPLPAGGGSLVPVVSGYFAAASNAGLTSASAASCLSPVWDAREAGKNGASVSKLCTLGSLATVPGPTPECDSGIVAGKITASELACGQADDLAFALSDQNPAEAQLTRHTLVVDEQTPGVTPTMITGPNVWPVLQAGSVDVTGCQGSGGGGGFGGYGGGPNPAGGTGGYVDPDPVYYEEDEHLSVGCNGSASGDSCSGDSSSSSGDDSCSGDSSSSSDDGCSGDSSSSGDDGCSGDSSSGGDSCSGDSSSGGDSCSGDSSGGGDSCSGSSSSSGDCSIRTGRRRPVSATTLTLALLLFPLRRLGRRRR